jgi:hypothetical protein
MSKQLYAIANGRKQIALIPEGGHADPMMLNHKLYWQSIDRFLSSTRSN